MPLGSRTPITPDDIPITKLKAPWQRSKALMLAGNQSLPALISSAIAKAINSESVVVIKLHCRWSNSSRKCPVLTKLPLCVRARVPKRVSNTAG